MLLPSPTLETAISLCVVLAEQAEREPPPWGAHRAALLRIMIAEVQAGHPGLDQGGDRLARVEFTRRVIHALRDKHVKRAAAL